MKEIKHQLKNNIIPDWQIEHLFVGTFNPEGGERVQYYYGRDKNQAWKILSIIFHVEFDPKGSSFFENLKNKKIACVDMINKIIAPAEKIESILGKGYKDTEIINSTVKRVYNTDTVLEIIKKNSQIKVYTTFGKGSSLREWKKEIEKIGPVINLVSPSLAAKVPKGSKKFDYILSDWSRKVLV